MLSVRTELGRTISVTVLLKWFPWMSYTQTVTAPFRSVVVDTLPSEV